MYAADEIVYEDDIIYKCLQDNTVNQRPAVSAAFWQPYTNNQFATNSDLLKIMPKQFELPVQAQASSDIVPKLLEWLDAECNDKAASWAVKTIMSVVREKIYELMKEAK